jgi:hypothetical protein
VYLASHAAGHLLLRLAWLYDLKLLLQHTPDLSWASVVSIARDSRMQAPTFLALNAAREAFYAPVPESVLKELKPPAWQGALFRRWFSPEALVRAPLAGKKWTQYATLPLLASGLGESTGYALHHLGRGLRRKFAIRFPALAPERWRG